MFRIILHRALIEPQAAIGGVRSDGDRATVALRIDGLLCSACAANVRHHIETLDGVREASVDLDSGEARVTYDPSQTRPDAFVAAVERAVILRPLRRLLAGLGRRRVTRAAH